jgi:hypothetical protein
LNPTAPGFSAAARAAGTILAAGLVAGLVPGPVIAIVGALALVTFGRSLVAPREEAVLDAAALALVAASLLAGALRWGTLDLDEIRGAQTVLGPTVLLGPRGAAVAAWLAAGAGVLALAEWEAFPGGKLGPGLFWWVTETLLGALALVSVFWGPEIAGADEGSSLAIGLGTWFAATAIVGGTALGISYLVRRVRVRSRTGLLLVSAIALGLSIGLIGSMG